MRERGFGVGFLYHKIREIIRRGGEKICKIEQGGSGGGLHSTAYHIICDQFTLLILMDSEKYGHNFFFMDLDFGKKNEHKQSFIFTKPCFGSIS